MLLLLLLMLLLLMLLLLLQFVSITICSLGRWYIFLTDAAAP